MTLELVAHLRLRAYSLISHGQARHRYRDEERNVTHPRFSVVSRMAEQVLWIPEWFLLRRECIDLGECRPHHIWRHDDLAVTGEIGPYESGLASQPGPPVVQEHKRYRREFCESWT